MIFKMCGVWLFFLLLFFISDVGANVSAAAEKPVQPEIAQPESTDFEVITAEELKTKMDKNEPVTIIDVRSTDSYIDSSNKIRGAIHVKVRRLRYRLTMPPLKNVPRDREVITYCACPSDEASIAAAKVLSDAGFKRVRVLKGGWRGWLKTNGPVESKPRN